MKKILKNKTQKIIDGLKDKTAETPDLVSRETSEAVLRPRPGLLITALLSSPVTKPKVS